MSEHFIEKCSVCEEVISQCRCADCSKTIKYSVCQKCKSQHKGTSYFGGISILIFTDKDIDFDIDTETFDNGRSQLINGLKSKNNWSDFTLVFLDKGNGELNILKDNTSKFSVPNYQIQNKS